MPPSCSRHVVAWGWLGNPNLKPRWEVSQQEWPRSTFLGCPGTQLHASILPQAAHEIPHGKVCFSQMNASWWSLSCLMYSSHGLRTHRDFDMRWACISLPSCGELDALMPGIFFSYSALLLLSIHFVVCTKVPPTNHKAEDV